MSLIVDIIKFPFRAVKKGTDVVTKEVKKQIPIPAEKEALKQSFVMDMSSILTSYGFTVDESIKFSQDFYNSNKEKIRDVLGLL
jgi:hypothetical protein